MWSGGRLPFNVLTGFILCMGQGRKAAWVRRSELPQASSGTISGLLAKLADGNLRWPAMSQSDRANVFNLVADQHLVYQVNELHSSRDTPVRSLVLDPQAKSVLLMAFAEWGVSIFHGCVAAINT